MVTAEFPVPQELTIIRSKITEVHDRRLVDLEGEEKRKAQFDYQKDTREVRSQFPTAVPDEVSSVLSKVDKAKDLVLELGRDSTQHPGYEQMNRFFMTAEDEEQYKQSFWLTIGGFQLHGVPLPSIFNIVPGVEPDAPLRIYSAASEAHTDKYLTSVIHDWSLEDNRPVDTEFPGTLLSLKTIDRENYIHMRFSHDDNAALYLSFFEDENWDKSRTDYWIPTELESSVLEYHSSIRPVGTMTGVESKIFAHYLDRFVYEANEGRTDKAS